MSENANFGVIIHVYTATKQHNHTEVIAVRILHTSDLHLRTDTLERWEALELIVDKAKENLVDVLVICGDLFDSKEDATKSYERLRKIFSEAPFQTLILPGNHDETFYEDGLYLGNNVTVILSENNVFEFGDVKIIAVPFKKEHSSSKETVKVIHEANTHTSHTKPNILLFHGELIAPFYEPDDFGERGRYMPIDLSIFKSLNFQYILAGHFHTKLSILKTSDKFFIYPGSPVSITKKERGKRKVNLLEVGKEPQELEIESFYYEELEIRLSIFDEQNPVDKFIEKLKNFNTPANCSPIFKVTGHFDGAKHALSESELNSKLQAIAKNFNPKSEVEFLAKDLGRLSNNPVFEKILEKVGKINDEELNEEDKRQLIDIFINAMI
uniref:DNA repair exonuclease n=1 Tax=Fervidobacterium pennivorans TaxID=93466 RepID=A0A7V4KCK4_FERPE